MKKAFKPEILPISIADKDLIDILKLENDARAKVEKFSSVLERSVLKKELLMLFAFTESIQSTRIEGTQASLSEVMEAETAGKTNKDITEVINYFDALSSAEDLLKEIPISTRMFLRLHKVILSESRGKTRSPGEYRKVQNFIGPTTKIEDATYVPPEPQFVTQYMSNLEKYINDEYQDNFGVLSRAAIIHGQFETIHPFLDGNGRLGRILIIIYLLDKKVITHPSFFVSEELEKNKYKYYALLNGLRSENPKWKEWIVFFLHASIKQAEKYIEKLLDIENMYNLLVDFAKKEKISLDTILFIFRKPIFTVNNMKDDLSISYNTARRYTNKLLESGKIFADDKKRNTMYRFYDLIDKL